MVLLTDVRIYHREAQYKDNRLGLVIVLPKNRAHSIGNLFVANETRSSILVFVGHATCPITRRAVSHGGN